MKNNMLGYTLIYNAIKIAMKYNSDS